MKENISYEPEEIINNLKKLNFSNLSVLSEINQEKNEILEQIIINLLENKFLMYFNRIKYLDDKSKEKLFPKYFQNPKRENKVILDLSMQLYKQAINFLDKISSTNNEENIYGRLYSITYIKLYSFKVIGFTKNDLSEIDEYKEFFQIINNIKNKNFKKVILIYILKLYYYYLDNNIELLKYLSNNILDRMFDDDFSILFKNEDITMNNYYLFPIEKDKYEKYLQNLKQFENIKRDKFSGDERAKQFIINLLKSKDIDTLLIISTNKIFFYLYPNYDEIKIEEYKNFFLTIESIIHDYFHNNYELLKLLNLFYNSEIFFKNIFPHIKNNKLLEILLYGFRYCVQSIYSENNILSEKTDYNIEIKDKFFYKSLLSNNHNKSINNNYIPGIDNPEYLHLVTLETIITHLNTKPDRHGCYVCSCGYYYDIDPCGFPTKNRTFDCPVCGLKIGWGPKPVKVGEETHGMVIRPGHLRIFKDEKAKKYQMRVFDEVDDNIPNMILDDYIKNIIEPIRKKNKIGIGDCSKNYFEKKNKKIRNLTQIGYRFLNFIFYSHLFFGYLTGIISKIDLKQYLIKDMSIIEIIETDWKLLSESLEKKSVNCIQIFLNLIFNETSELIKSCKYLEKPEDREKFEEEIEKIISKYIDKYDDYNEKYIEKNKFQILFNNFYNVETIITELIPITEEIYKEKDYPMLKYFILTKYKSRLDCLNHIQDKNKYSLTYQILLNKPEYSLIQYLPIFNNFINYMNKTYSFKITREEAHKRKLKDEKIFTNQEFIDKFNKFIQIWNIIKPYAKKYKCNTEMPMKEFNSDDYLSYFLNDISEFGFGMYLSAASQNFIEWQNSFLNNIIENNLSPEYKLHKYVNNLNKKIGINEADDKQILIIEQRFKNSEYKNIEEVVYSYSERNIFKNDKIYYNDYNNFKYDYDKIEKEFGKIILPGIQLFKSEDDLELVVYWGEGFKGKRSQILIEFYIKYPQKELNFKEKNIIIEWIKKKLIIESSSLNNALFKNILKQYFSFTQKLIIYLTTKIVAEVNTSIASIIKLLLKDNDFPSTFIEFFNSQKDIITIEKLMDIYIFFEHLCFNDLLLLLKEEYKKEIDEKIKNNITKNLEIKKIYSKKDLAKAIRRLISRYLVGTGVINDINTGNDLCFELSREDLWDEKIKKIDELDNKLKEQLGEIKLKVDQALSLYNLIGIEDRKEIENIFK